MGKTNQILKMATAYSLFVFADLRENMALRILHALIPTLVQDIHDAQEIEHIQKFMAFDLIPGAKEIFELGAKAVAYEFDCSTNENLKQEVQQTIANKEYTKGLELAVPGFLSGFRVTTGNAAWSNVPVEEGEGYNEALQLLQKTKRERELTNYLTTPNDPGMISQEFKKAPPSPPKKQNA